MKPRLLFIVNHGAFFASHRLPIAAAARASGFEVALMTGAAGSEAMEAQACRQIKAAGIPHYRARFSTSGLNPFKEWRGLLDAVRLLRRFRPDIVHCVSPKGILIGGLAAKFVRPRGVVFAISGMGFAMTKSGSAGGWRRCLAYGYLRLLRWLFRTARTIIVQNLDDRDLVLTRLGVRENQLILIPGSGVDLSVLDCAISAKAPLILFVGRMLGDKGVRELVEAARLLRERVNGWRFLMVGATDYKNPTAVSEAELSEWRREGLVEMLGHIDNCDDLFKQASIVCLPSYREGMPKVLLEAAAAGCAVVTTDTVGCREAILPGETGFLVPLYDSAAVADAINRLVADRQLRESFGSRGRALAEKRFSLSAVVDCHLAIYDGILRNGDGGSSL